MELRKYQTEIIDKVTSHLETYQRCCVSLATGGGKTVVFSSLVNQLKGRTLICVHREELVHQTSRTLSVKHDFLLPKIKSNCLTKNVVVAMVQTLHNRLKKGEIELNSFDNIIIDECHRGEFMKILEEFTGKVIGFTATPNYEKKEYFFVCPKCGSKNDKPNECCNRKMQKYKREIPLSEYYHKLIHGVEISELIDMGYLVQDENFILDVDTSRLVFDPARNEYTEESISLVFGSKDAIENTVNVYKKLAQGKKTILFNPNTLVNQKLYDAFIEAGINAKMYDSKNSEENRLDLVEWFKSTPDACLMNVQVFTTGFDCTDVEVVFLNKKTQSLNLFLQMVGRGGRITDKIFKPSFRVVDMGGNIDDLGEWSKRRNWNDYFYGGEVKPCGTPKPAIVRTCHKCESIIAANSLICPKCGEEKRFVTGSGVTGLPVRNGKPVIPSPSKILYYCLENDLDCAQARKIVYNYVAEMFENVPQNVLLSHKRSGLLYTKTKRFIMPYYFAIQKSDMKGNKCRTIEAFTNETIKAIERSYHDRG
jgi:superfamily II DNA or RNA helicase